MTVRVNLRNRQEQPEPVKDWKNAEATPDNPASVRNAGQSTDYQGPQWNPSFSQSQEAIGRPDISGLCHNPVQNWTPKGRAHGIPDLVENRLRKIQDYKLCKIQDFVEDKLCKTQDFLEDNTLQDTGLPQKIGTFTPRTGILLCAVLFENTDYQDNYLKMDTTGVKG